MVLLIPGKSRGLPRLYVLTPDFFASIGQKAEAWGRARGQDGSARLPSEAMKIAELLTLSSFWACAAAQQPLGPPPLEAVPPGPPPFAPAPIDPTVLESWSGLDEALVSLGGVEAFALVRWTYVGESRALESSRKILEREGLAAMRRLLDHLGVRGEDPLPLLPPPVEQHANRKLFHLWLCDAACIEAHLEAAGAPMTAEAAKAAYAAFWEEARAERARETRLAELDRKFLDLDPKRWRSNGPWWLQHTASVVPYIGGEPVRIGVGQANTETGDVNLRRTAASDRARARLARSLPASESKAGELSEALLRFSRVVVFEQGAQTWALAICDQRCEKRSGRL